LAVSGLTTSVAAISSLDRPAGGQGHHLTLAVGQRRDPGRGLGRAGRGGPGASLGRPGRGERADHRAGTRLTHESLSLEKVFISRRDNSMD
jgi:hypothetical protein